MSVFSCQKHQKTNLYIFLVCFSVFITVLLLRSFFEVNTGATGQYEINRTDIQPCLVWGWVTVLKLHSYEQSTHSGIWITNIPPADPGLPNRPHTPLEPHYEIMYCRWVESSCNHSPAVWSWSSYETSRWLSHHWDNGVHKLKGWNWD